MFSKKVAAGEFVKRQTPESGYSHFEGPWALLEKLVEIQMRPGGNLFPNMIKPGYRDGVVLVDMGPRFAPLFRSAIVKLDEDSRLTANYAPRRKEEAAFIRVSAKAKKQVAKHASVVLYRHDVLAENNERQTDAEWEIVAVKARTSKEEEPMDPYTMARNFLQLKGGTKGDFTAQQFAESIVYWNSHCMCQSRRGLFKKLVDWFENNVWHRS